MAIVTALLSVLTSGAGGGLLGGIFGLFKQNQERKERVEMARIELDRDQAEYANAKEEREHALQMLSKQGELKLQEVETEAEAAMELANQSALSSAQDAFKNLKTSTGMDNFRASVRPLLAYWAAILFTVMLWWAFDKFNTTIDAAAGRELLLTMLGTLTFIVTSVISFYYVSRRNSAPKL